MPAAIVLRVAVAVQWRYAESGLSPPPPPPPWKFSDLVGGLVELPVFAGKVSGLASDGALIPLKHVRGSLMPFLIIQSRRARRVKFVDFLKKDLKGWFGGKRVGNGQPRDTNYRGENGKWRSSILAEIFTCAFCCAPATSKYFWNDIFRYLSTW